MALEQNLILTCRIRSNLISAGAKILLSRAFAYSFMKVASPHSFTLFRAEKTLFRGVPGVWHCQNMPPGPVIGH